jgi:predicted HTH domain antitoxin
MDFIENLTATQKLLILLLGVKNSEPIINHLRLQKVFFYSLLLMAKNQKEKEELLEESGFYPHKAGPYSETLEEDIEQLSLANIVEYKPTIKRAENIKLTEKGKEVFDFLITQTPEELIKILEESKDFLNDKNISDEEVLAIIYELEKEYTSKSSLIELIKRNKIKYAISLYKKGKISIERAAEIAGMSVLEFKNLL